MKIPTLSLTDLVDIIMRSGVQKLTKVSQVKTRPDYEPAFDYYKQLREAIVESHQNGIGKKQFQIIAGSSATGNKRSNYATAINGYVKWWGNKSFTWAEPPRTKYSKNGVDVIINPELGLVWNTEHHLIKLYLKNDPLSKNRADLILSLMRHALSKVAPAEAKMSILDVRASKLFTESTKTVPIAVIDAELAYVAALWSAI